MDLKYIFNIKKDIQKGDNIKRYPHTDNNYNNTLICLKKNILQAWNLNSYYYSISNGNDIIRTNDIKRDAISLVYLNGGKMTKV